MEKNQVLQTLKYLRETSPKRNFSQSIDLIINLQNLDLKKPEHKVDFYVQIPYSKGKKIRLCGFADAQLAPQTKKFLDTTILKEEFEIWKNKKKDQKKLANSHDFFIAQAELMAQVAATFGKVLGSRGKMPDPKAGCVVPGSANIEPIVKKLQTIVRVQAKNELSIKLSIGNENMKDEELAENILTVYNTLIPKLPQEKNNLKYLAIKFTMGPLFKIGQKPSESQKPDTKNKK